MEDGRQSQPAADAVPPRQPRPLAPLWAVLVVIGLFFAAMAIGGALLSLYPLLRHWPAAQSRDWLNNIDNEVGPQFVYTVLAYGFLLVPILLIMRWRGFKLRDVGFKMPRWRDALYGAVAYPIYFLANIILTALVAVIVPKLNLEQKQQIGFTGASGAWPLLLTFASLAVVPPLVEEFVMRGFLFTNLRLRLKLVWATLLTSVVFAAGHLQFGSGAPLLWVAAIDTFILSLFLVYLRVKTDSLWAGITLHAIKNTLAFLTIFILHKG